MPTFSYEAMNSVGQGVKDEVDAATSEEAIAKVRALGYFPTKIKEKVAKGAARPAAGAATAAPKRRSSGRVSRKLLCTFTRQLSTLIEAGLPILRSLRILEQQQKPGALRMAIRMVAEDVEGGATLSEALGRHPKAFDRLFVNMVRAGEIGGVLDVILQRLADFVESSQALKRKVVGAMIYPVAVLSFSMIIVMGIMLYIVPSFQKIFSEMKEDLPGPTLFLMKASSFIKEDFGWAWIMAFPVGVFMLIRLLKMSEGGRYLVDNVKLNIPIMGRIVSKTAIARFTRTLGTLLAAGVPILEAINITRETAGNAVYSRALLKVHDGIREGDTFAEPLRRAKIVEPMVINMIDVGEETGELDKMLDKIADTYDEEVETLVSGMVAMLEPIMVIFLGVIIGFIVVALFLPMIALVSNVSGS